MIGKLDTHLREIDRAANEMFAQLTKQIVAVEGVTEALKTARYQPNKQQICLCKSSLTEKNL